MRLVREPRKARLSQKAGVLLMAVALTLLAVYSCAQQTGRDDRSGAPYRCGAKPARTGRGVASGVSSAEGSAPRPRLCLRPLPPVCWLALAFRAEVRMSPSD